MAGKDVAHRNGNPRDNRRKNLTVKPASQNRSYARTRTAGKRNFVHRVERDIRNWSHNFLEVPNAKLNGLPPCPYAKQAWLDNKVTFSINTGIEGLIRAVRIFDSHDYDIVVWAEEM